MSTTTFPTDERTLQQTRGDNALVEQPELVVEGMPCASCASRIERTLTRQPGVAEASVNLATDRASVTYDPATVTVEDLHAKVQRAGYRLARLPTAGAEDGANQASRSRQPELLESSAK